MEKRIEWIDICKAFGIFFIFLGHYGTNAGMAYPWVFSFHVPLFFFISGLLENYNQRSFLQNLKKKFISIIIPFFFFGLTMTVVQVIQLDNCFNVSENIQILLKGGIRNTCTMNEGLWFLTCLFTLEMLFSIIKQLKSKPLIFVLCIGLYLISEYFIIPKPATSPHWYWNLDSAIHYIIYYCIGWLIFKPLNTVLSSNNKKIFFFRCAAFTACTIYSISSFLGKNISFKLAEEYTFLNEMIVLITPLFTIYIIVELSYHFKKNIFLKRIGENSIYFCGNEALARLLLQTGLSCIGLSLTIETPLHTYICTAVLIVIVNFLLLPFQKNFLKKFQNFLTSTIV